jgi:hypothetical protein
MHQLAAVALAAHDLGLLREHSAEPVLDHGDEGAEGARARVPQLVGEGEPRRVEDDDAAPLLRNIYVVPHYAGRGAHAHREARRLRVQHAGERVDEAGVNAAPWISCGTDRPFRPQPAHLVPTTPPTPALPGSPAHPRCARAKLTKSCRTRWAPRR